MNSKQKTIKYAAMAFGILLAAVIIGGAAITVLKITGVFGRDKGTGKSIDFNKDFSSKDIENLDFENLSGTMEITTGNSFRIEAKNVPEEFVAKIENDTLIVAYEKKKQWNIFPWIDENDRVEITITVPKDFQAEEIQISNGSGKVKMNGLKSDFLLLDNGSGRMDAEEIDCGSMELSSGSGPVVVKQAVVTNSIEIDAGSGNITLESIESQGLEFSGGSGGFELSGRVDGDISIDSGSGRTTFSLQNARSEYNIDADIGSGTFWLNGDKKKDDYVEKNQGAEYEIEVNSGSGRVSIEFSKDM